MRLIGPNCLGIMMPRMKLNASFAAHTPRAGNLALISQSGAIAGRHGGLGRAEIRRLLRHSSRSATNSTSIFADLLDYFALDRDTGAILLYIEAVRDARKFMSAARAAARVKPIVVVKSGGGGARRPRRGDPHRRAGGRRRRLRRRVPPRRHAASVRPARTVRLRRDARPAQAAARQAACDTDQWRRSRRARGRTDWPNSAASRGAFGAAASGSMRCCRRPGRDRTRSTSSATLMPSAMRRRWRILLADPDNDAVLVMNVQTAVAPAGDIADTVTRVVASAREQQRPAKPVLSRSGSGRDPRSPGRSIPPAFPTSRPRTMRCAVSCTS